MAKPRIATASLCGCFGCHMSLLDIDERLLALVERVDFDRSPIDDIKTLSGPVDIGLVEGGCCNEENVHVLREFRKHCKVLVAVGDCAISGGVPALRNRVPLEECLREAFFTDVRPVMREWRESKGLPANPLAAFRESGYLAKAEAERGAKNLGAVSSYA